MRYINNSDRSADWDAYITNSNPTHWTNATKTRAYIELHKHLHKQQNGLCIYCEQKIDGIVRNKETAIQPSHIDHVLPKSDALFKAWTFEQNNLVMSCMGFVKGKYEQDAHGRVKQVKGMTHDFCGHPKDSLMDYDLFIDPVFDKETHLYFEFDTLGNIEPSKKNPAKANYTIKLLKLDNPELIEWRLNVYTVLAEDTELDIESHLATFPLFYSMVKHIWGIA